MVEDPRSTSRTQSDSHGDRACIRLQVDHPARLPAERLLTAMGGRRCLPATGLVYEFLTTAARDDALERVRSKTGYAVASPFDGRPWLPGDPAARWVTCCSDAAGFPAVMGA